MYNEADHKNIYETGHFFILYIPPLQIQIQLF